MGKGRPSISRKLQAEIFCRDRWLCHCCERPVVFAPAMKYLQRLLKDAGYREAAYWRNAYDRHGAPLLDVFRSKHGEPVDWDGFSSLLLFLAGKYATDLTPTEKDWVGALKSATSNRGES